MPDRDLKLKVDEYSSAIGRFKGLEIDIGKIYSEDWDEAMGPTPWPSVGSLRELGQKAAIQDTSHFTCLSVISVVYAHSVNAT